MEKPKILVVEDEEDIRELIAFNLYRNGHVVTEVGSGEEALSAIREELPDLIVLDLMLPGLDGLAVCRKLREQEATAALPVLMLTALGEEADVVKGLEIGADDYVTKPFSPRVLVARVAALLRRRGDAPPSDEDVVTVGALCVDPGRREVSYEGQSIDLTYTEFGVLLLLARRPGWVYTRQQIIDEAQGVDAAVTCRSVDVHVVSLRKKLGEGAGLIETVRGVGYRCRDSDSAEAPA